MSIIDFGERADRTLKRLRKDENAPYRLDGHTIATIPDLDSYQNE